MQLKYVIVIIIILLFFLIALGSLTGEQCVSIDNEKACWKIASIYVTSELCPNVSLPCEAKPEQQQYNAVVDLLLRSCEKTKQGSYADENLNNRILEVEKNLVGFDITIQELCEQPGMVLTRRQYG